MSRFRPLAPLLAMLTTAACNSTELPDTSSKAETVQEHAQEQDAQDLTPQQKEQFTLLYAQIQQMETLGKRCGWLEEIEQVAVAASRKERQAWMNWHHMDMALADAKASELIKKSESIECKSAEGEKHRLGLRYGAWQIRSSWAMRGYSLLPGNERPSWFEGKSSVAHHRSGLEAAITGLKTIGGDSIQTSLDVFNKESEQLLAVRCSSTDKTCPAASTDAGWRNYAKTVVEQAEAFASALDKVKDKTGRPPAS